MERVLIDDSLAVSSAVVAGAIAKGSTDARPSQIDILRGGCGALLFCNEAFSLIPAHPPSRSSQRMLQLSRWSETSGWNFQEHFRLGLLAEDLLDPIPALDES